ncbi:hypothetical protein E1293_20520 [Actinomadura darangshiensis]|uniref:WXG100 family type VII secretion target n=1 Tax=Actinomadura darangshiensis TaxID=705336 RepID=A0A4R5B6K3_9ACTN|nr:hypothetical protein [Actinomadura darangshiensis]TDD80499.1 hypothetical protein E1293_20520 [Actinomadura darangshiensis]
MGDQKSEIDTGEVKRILKILKENLTDLQKDDGNYDSVHSNCDVTSTDLGRYSAAAGISASSSSAYNQISTQYGSFLDSYKGIVEALEEIVGNHDKKEQENTNAANRVKTSDSGAAPTTGNTSTY